MCIRDRPGGRQRARTGAPLGKLHEPTHAGAPTHAEPLARARCKVGIGAEARVERLRAVVTRPDRNAVLVQERGEVGGVHGLVVEGAKRRACVALGRVWAVQAQARHLRQPRVQVGTELVLVCLDRVHAERGEVVDRGAESDRLRDGGRTYRTFRLLAAESDHNQLN